MGLLYEADSRVWLVCVFLFLLFFLEKEKQKTKRLAATGMHWTSAEKDSSPWMHRRWLNQQSKAWKEEEGEEGGGKKGRRGGGGGGVSESLAYLLYNLLK